MSGNANIWVSLAPEILVALGAVAVLALDVSLPQSNRRALAGAGFIALLAALCAVFLAWPLSLQAQPLFSGALRQDPYSLFFDAIFLLAGLLAILLSLRYVEGENLPAGEYYALTLSAVLGMMLMAASTDLVTLFLSFEILSVSVYVLAGIARGRAESAEASLKYFLLGAFSSGFLVYGIALVYGATGSTGLEMLRERLLTQGFAGNPVLLIGLALLVVGFAFKMALVPFHVWVPDVYQGAPLPVTAFMSAGVKAAAFAAFGRVLFDGFRSLHDVWQPALLAIAALTMILGNTAAIAQSNIKRMLAYSSIAHAGYMLVGLASFTAGDMALGSVIYYALVYAAMNTGAFAVVLIVGRESEEHQDLDDYRGLSQRHPWVAAAMALFMVSLAGLPPTAGFLGKFYLLTAAVRANLDGMAILLVLASAVSWYYYFRVVWLMYMEGSGENTEPASRAPSLRAATVVSAFLVILLGILPSAILNLAQSAALPLAHSGIPVIGGL